MRAILYDCLTLPGCAERDGTQWCPCPRRLEGVERGGGKRRYLAPMPKPAPAELTEAERREHIAEWVKLTAEKVLHGATPPSGGKQPTEKAIRKAAKELGVSAATVSRAVAAENLDAEVKAVADELGIGTVTRAKAAALPTQEAQIAKLVESRTKPAPAVKNAFESEEDWRRQLFTVWNRGAQDWRERAMEAMDQPVFDKTRSA